MSPSPNISSVLPHDLTAQVISLLICGDKALPSLSDESPGKGDSHITV